MNKIYILLIFTIIFTPIILGLLLNIPTGFLTIGDESSWVGFFGNYSGGIIGGIVAFVVANHQVKKQMEEQIKNEEEVKYINQLPSIINLIFELEEMKTSINNAHNMRNALQNLKAEQNLQFDLNYPKYSMKNLNMANWDGISNVQDVEFQRSLITLRNDYCKIAEALTGNIEDLEIEIHTILGNGGTKNLNKLTLELEVLKSDKEWAWKELISNDYISIIDDSLEIANTIVECIEEMMSKRHLIRDKQ